MGVREGGKEKEPWILFISNISSQKVVIQTFNTRIDIIHSVLFDILYIYEVGWILN